MLHRSVNVATAVLACTASFMAPWVLSDQWDSPVAAAPSANTPSPHPSAIDPDVPFPPITSAPMMTFSAPGSANEDPTDPALTISPTTSSPTSSSPTSTDDSTVSAPPTNDDYDDDDDDGDDNDDNDDYDDDGYYYNDDDTRIQSTNTTFSAEAYRKERIVLDVLFASVGGDNWYEEDEQDHCEWKSVTCDWGWGHITQLVLYLIR
mmetsp:Transcript_28842/g.57485  ORF Transcript_28842/g.57485 Transcript_28842/m.57485 type:complete len:206 (+) Transcript_28842:297-914(+)